MGEVYRARDTRLKRDVAIKVLPDAFANDSERLARFQREAELLATLNHPNIAQIYGLEDRALVLELVEGPTLADRIAQGPIPLDEALPIAKQIAEALQVAHEQGVIHRDLKPANIKLTPDGTVKVLDFGLAKAISPAVGEGPVPAVLSQSPTITTPAMTMAGIILGTAAYMSPEQAKARAADKRSDIWAFGCVLYEMLTSKRAFDGEDMTDVLGAVVRLEPNWEALSTSVPLPIRTLLQSCLVKDRRHRVADISTALFVLEKTSTLAPPVGTVLVAPAPVPRRSAAWMLSAAAGAATLVAIAALIRSSGGPRVEAPVIRLEVATPSSISPQTLALSRDGRQLAFVANDRGVSRIWVRGLEQSAARPIVGSDGGNFPFWSHSGRSLGFFADGKLKRIDLPDGTPRALADAPSGRGGTWNADGVIVFAPSTVGPLMRIPANGGTPEPVTRVAIDRGSHRSPQFLPDGRRFTFLMALAPADVRGTYVGSLDGSEARRVLPNENAAFYAPPGVLVSVYETTLVAVPFDMAAGDVAGEPITIAEDVGVAGGSWRGAFATSDAGVIAHRALPYGLRQLTWMDRTGNERGTIGPPNSDGINSPSLSFDGQRVAVVRRVRENADVWTVDVNRGGVNPVTSEPGIDGGPIWSPDGQLMFHSDRHGVFEVLRWPLTGPTERVISLKESSVPQCVSADGQMLVFAVQSSTTASDIWVKRLTGSGETFPVVQTPADDLSAQLSPDGSWLAYESTVSGKSEVYLQTFPVPGERMLVSTGGGVQPRWRRDGRELFYVAPDARLMAVPITISSQGPRLENAVALFRTRLVANTAAPTFQKPQYQRRPGRSLSDEPRTGGTANDAHPIDNQLAGTAETAT